MGELIINPIHNIYKKYRKVNLVNPYRFGLGYSPELNAIVLSAYSRGFPVPDASELLLIDTFIGNLKSSGFWTKQDYILNFAYNNTAFYDFGRINWKDPYGSLASIVGGVPYSVNGYRGNGSDGSVLTPFNPSTMGVNYTLNNAGRGAVVYVDGTVTAANRLIDYNTTGFSRMTNINAVQQRINSGSTSLPTNVNLAGIGYKGIFRNSGTNVELYNKGVKSTVVSNSTSVDNGVFRLFSTGGFWGDIGISFYHVGGYLTETEKETFRTNYNAYLTSIGLTALT